MDFFKRKQKQNRLSVLHIDDSQWIRIPVSVLLRRHFGMRVLEASSGEEGIAIAAREHLDLIILDVMMPGMDGFDTLAQLKKNPMSKDTPVLMCTVRDLAREVTMAVRLGAVGYLAKPIEEEALIEKVGHILTATGKWGKIEAIGRNRYQIPPDIHTDFVIPKGESRQQSSLNAAASHVCKFCRASLEFITEYAAWYCRPCRKYPEIES